MSEAPTRRRLLADLTPLRVSPAYRRMWVGAVASATGAMFTTVAVGLQVYEVSRSTFAVGLVGLFALVPLVASGLYGSSVVDAYDRRRVILTTSTGMLVIAVLFAVQAAVHADQLWLLYALVAVQNAFYPINNAARSAITPRLIGKELLPAANALNGLVMGLSMTIGPLLAGALVSWGGYAPAYGVEAVMLLGALYSIHELPALPPEGEVPTWGLRSVIEGFAYLGTRPNVRMTFLVDLAAMCLAMPRVLFPAIAAVDLGGGAGTVGLLYAGIAAGTFLAGVFSGPLGSVQRQGRAVIGAVVIWGTTIALFGLLVAVLPAGPVTVGVLVLVLAVGGAADAVSGVFRNTILQSATPDALRGRLQGVFIVVVAGGPRAGDVVLGALSGLTREAGAAVVGGLACIAVVIVLAFAQPGFARYDARDPTP